MLTGTKDARLRLGERRRSLASILGGERDMQYASNLVIQLYGVRLAMAARVLLVQCSVPA